MGNAIERGNIRVFSGGHNRDKHANKSRSTVVLEIHADGSIGKNFVNVSKEDCVAILNGLAMAQIRVLSILNDQ